ncbi:MAG: ECF transporter S component [Lachnospiraceae bacterium]|nr:ECF transporter S component [Lachnospiraceae bacterium]MBR2753386.1 ECF transporter S component [Lachnospiraceae bacterium]
MNEQRTGKFSSKTLVTMAMLCAIAFIAKWISNFLPTVQGFLSFDLKDVVIAIGGFILGPLQAALIALIVSLIEMITISSTGPIGLVMNLLSSCSFACVAAAIYRRNKNMKSAVTGLVCGVVCMTVIMLLWNWLITPLYMGVPRSVVAGMLMTVFLPFNLAKGGINATLTMVLYKPVVTALRKAGLVAQSDAGKRTTKWGVLVVSLVLLVTFILWGLVLAKVI